jgi:diguanylate cyclase (GGDEF)-like protein
MKIRLLFLLWMGYCASLGVFAQDSLFFSTLSTRDGLPNSAIAAIAQDDRGFLWFGTQGALVRYDGYTYRVYENEPFEENALSHNQVQTLLMEKDVLWVGTYGGLNRLDLKTDMITQYLHDPENPDSLAGDLVVSLVRDRDGRLWVGTSKGLDRLDEKSGKFIHYRASETDVHAVPPGIIRSLLVDSQGTLWVGTGGGGLLFYNRDTDDFTRLPWNKSDPSLLPSPYIMSITETPDGELWFGSWYGGISRLVDRKALRFKTVYLADDRIYFVKSMTQNELFVGTWGGGLFEYNRTTGTVTRHQHTDGPGSIPNDVVYSAFLDSNDVYWVGTNGGGVARSERRTVQYRAYLHNPERKDSLPAGKVSSILEDHTGILWVGVYNGGLNRLDRETGTFHHYFHDPKNPKSFPNDIVNGLYEDREGRLWAATNDGLALYNRTTDDFTVYRHDPNNPDSIADSVIYSLKESPEGFLWVGTYTQGLERFNPVTGTFSHVFSTADSLVYALEYDRHGNLWIGNNNGLDRMENGQVVRRYRYDIKNPKGISSNTIRIIFRDSSGRLWMGTVGGGLLRYDEQTDTFVHFTKKQGLLDNTVRSILEVDDGSLWIGTATGIGVIDKSGSFFRGYSVYNDLKDREFHTGAWKSKDGKLYFGGQNAVYVLNPREALKDLKPPRVLVSEIQINGKNVVNSNLSSVAAPYIQSIRLPYDKNNISVSVSTVDFREPLRNLYSFKLEGFDKDWSNPSIGRRVAYTNLPGGHYTLRVRAADNDGVWNDNALRLPITIDSPPWATPWAYSFYVLLLLGFGFLSTKAWGRRVLQQRIEELTRLQEELQKANQRLDDLSMLDGLTEIPNRRRLDQVLGLLFADAVREKKPLAVIMFDIDYFKAFNDLYGHLRGDETLKQVAQSLQKSVERATDFVARFGGEEFIAVLSNTDKEGARTVAERIRSAVADLGIPHEGSTVAPVVTLSAGLFVGVPEPNQQGTDFIAQADTALYQAKSRGRNRLCDGTKQEL